MAEPPAPEELWEEILLRLPPDDPASLLRASLVCKIWRSIVSRRGFLRRLAELHRVPPMLGFFGATGSFVSTTAGNAFSLTLPTTASEPCALDCRHGRALLFDAPANEVIVWEPITGYQRRVPWSSPAEDLETFNAAVVCAAAACDHRSCHGGPFRVVLVEAAGGGDGSFASAREYSSGTGMWSEPTTIPITRDSTMGYNATILMGNSLYFCGFFHIIQYDLGGQGRLAVIDRVVHYGCDSSLIQAEDGGLGFARVEGSSLQLWSQQTSGEADAGWVLTRTIHLKNRLPAAVLSSEVINVIGFAEGVNLVFLHTLDGIFTIELKSGRARKVCTRMSEPVVFPLLPLLNFYAPGIQADAREQG